MTKREFYNAIISMNSVSVEMKEKAADLIAALDRKLPAIPPGLLRSP